MFRYRVYFLAACLCLGGIAAITWAQPDPGNPPGDPQPASKDPQWIDTFLPELIFRIQKEGESSEDRTTISGMFLNQEGLVLTVLTELRNDQILEVVPELLVDKAHPPKITVVARDPQTGLTLLKTPFRTRRFFRLAQQKQVPAGTVLTPLIPLLPPYSAMSFNMIAEEGMPIETHPASSIKWISLRRRIPREDGQSGRNAAAVATAPAATSVATAFSEKSETIKLFPTNYEYETLQGTALVHTFEVAAITIGRPVSVNHSKRSDDSTYYEAVTAESARPIIEQLLKKADLPPLPAPNPLTPLNPSDNTEEIPAEAVPLQIRYDNGEATIIYGVLLDDQGTIVSPVESFVGAKRFTSRWLDLDLELEWLSEEAFPRGLALLKLPSTSTAPHMEFEVKAIGVEPNDRVYRLRPQSKPTSSTQPDSKPILIVSVNQAVPMSGIPGANRSGLWQINQRLPTGIPLFHETGAFIGLVAPDFTEQGSFVIPADQAWIAYGNRQKALDVESDRRKFESGKQLVRTFPCNSLESAKMLRTRMAELFPAYQFSVNPKSQDLIIVPSPNAEFDDLHAIYALSHRMMFRIVEAEERAAAPVVSASKGASISIPVGMRVVTIPFNMKSAQGEAVKAEDRVDLMVTYRVRLPEGREIIEIKTFLTSIQVFATDSSSPGEKAQMKNISLLVTPDQAQTIQMAKSIGELTYTNEKGAHEANNLTPEQFRTQILQAPARPVSAPVPSQSSNSSADPNKTRAQALDRVSQELVQKYQSASQEDQPAIRKTLEAVTSELFRQRHQQRVEELKALESRLEKLRTSLNQREKLRDQIVQQRVADILNLETPLKWDDDSAPATPAKPGATDTNSSSPSSYHSPASQQSFEFGNSTEGPGSPQKPRPRSHSTSGSPGGSKPLLKTGDLPTTRPEDPAQPLLTGNILQVNFDGDAEISIGSTEGIKLGQVLEVRRQGPNTAVPAVAYVSASASAQEPPPTVFGFIGQLEVVAIQSDRATCIPVPGTRRDFMRKNDQVISDLTLSKNLDLSDDNLKALQGSWIEEAVQSSVAKRPEASGAKDAPQPPPKLDQNIWTIDGQLLLIRLQNGKVQARGVISLGRTKKTKFIQVRGLVESGDPVPTPVPTSGPSAPAGPRAPVDPNPSMTFCFLYRIQGDVLEMQGIENYKSLANLPAEFGTAATPDGRPETHTLKRLNGAVTDADQPPKAAASRPTMPPEEKNK
jgi:hypothetical protein